MKDYVDGSSDQYCQYSRVHGLYTKYEDLVRELGQIHGKADFIQNQIFQFLAGMIESPSNSTNSRGMPIVKHEEQYQEPKNDEQGVVMVTRIHEL